MKPENSHWYSPTGEPAHFQQKKDGTGTTPTTLAHAKKLGLYPSVTTVLKAVAKPALTQWLINNAVAAALTTPRKEGEDLDAFVARIMAVDAQDESRKAMDLGSEIHQAIEEHCAGRLFAPQFKPFVDAAMAQVGKLGRVVSSEKVLVHPSGFAGRTDCITEGQDLITVVDFKTSKKLPAKAAWPEALLQTAAYAASIGNTNNHRVQTAVLYIDTITPGETALFVTQDWEPHWCVFQHVFEVWKFLNGFDPVGQKIDRG